LGRHITFPQLFQGDDEAYLVNSSVVLHLAFGTYRGAKVS
jgi:hypothetical protein